VNVDGEPFVQLILNGRVISQMTTFEARDHARAVTESAEAADQDAFLMGFLQDKDKIGLDLNRAALVLVDYRKWREARSRKSGGPTSREDWTMPPGATP
jgi:hypothetical protein